MLPRSAKDFFRSIKTGIRKPSFGGGAKQNLTWWTGRWPWTFLPPQEWVSFW